MGEDIVADIARRLDVNGRHRYGLSDLNQIQHGLQAAWLAERAGDPPSLIAAALLHDIGHMLHELGENPAEAGIDDRHEEVGDRYLRDRFGPEVCEPVRLGAGLFRQAVEGFGAEPVAAGRADGRRRDRRLRAPAVLAGGGAAAAL
jgi:predicted HD phosphohydrolase